MAVGGEGAAQNPYVGDNAWQVPGAQMRPNRYQKGPRICAMTFAFWHDTRMIKESRKFPILNKRQVCFV